MSCQKRFSRTSSTTQPNGKPLSAESCVDNKNSLIFEDRLFTHEPECLSQGIDYPFQLLSTEPLFETLAELLQPQNQSIYIASDVSSLGFAPQSLDPTYFPLYECNDSSDSLSSGSSPSLSPFSYPSPLTPSLSPSPYAEMGSQSYSINSNQDNSYSLFVPSCSPAEIVQDSRSLSIRNTLAKPRSRARMIKAPRSHVCDHTGCNKTFDRRYNLQQHLKTHRQNERPFVCEDQECSKAFIRRADLERHARIHSGDKPFDCGWCGQAFSRTEARHRHVRKAHPEVCSESFE
ncbi:hypothetical protein BGZ80_008347 [Entomortierella chlamydospora]|uniref:C2H2-type domain-containing protein n=1 Tax=Entomortierella chlamydospora TaxID=101097 RepID=A0A9P6N4J7_9FUNG|nr:hypothetical protein BGZ79_009907 [Entomortierella chlamydospora]KAG0023722.1 hypothetical protein BGZ80_008347 [Entomortierella chlamydospora]